MEMEKFNENYSSMNLQTIPNSRKTYLNNKSNPMDVSDIDGARPKFIQKPRLIRDTFINKNDDIDKSRSNIIIPKSVNKPDRQLQVDDIAGTRTKVNKFSTTRKTDPLNPVYQLPHVEYAPYPEAKFIRDSMAIDDIEGTRMRETFAIRMERAGKIIEKDTSLLQERPKPQPRKDNFLLDVADINMKQPKIKGERCTNPLEPVYRVPVSKEQKQHNIAQKQIGFIQGTKAPPPKQRMSQKDFCLRVEDIDGAAPRPSKKVEANKGEPIPEAKSGSLKRGINTNRKTNPLQPDYCYLGASEPRVSYSRPKTAVQRLDAFLVK